MKTSNSRRTLAGAEIQPGDYAEKLIGKFPLQHTPDIGISKNAIFHQFAVALDTFQKESESLRDIIAFDIIWSAFYHDPVEIELRKTEFHESPDRIRHYPAPLELSAQPVADFALFVEEIGLLKAGKSCKSWPEPNRKDGLAKGFRHRKDRLHEVERITLAFRKFNEREPFSEVSAVRIQRRKNMLFVAGFKRSQAEFIRYFYDFSFHGT